MCSKKWQQHEAVWAILRFLYIELNIFRLGTSGFKSFFLALCKHEDFEERLSEFVVVTGGPCPRSPILEGCLRNCLLSELVSYLAPAFDFYEIGDPCLNRSKRQEMVPDNEGEKEAYEYLVKNIETVRRILKKENVPVKRLADELC